MNNEQKRDLCWALMNADSEEEVIVILSNANLWENRRVWRLYGDRENNFSTIGNQQNRSDAALVEKLINSVDACLMHECLARGVDPQSSAAPQSITQAVARFYEESRNSGSVFSGQMKVWSDEMRRTIARNITLAATGATGRKGDPCLTIADYGEGQTPRKFGDTFLSLEKSNKLRIPFVQGKFNMGGTGVLEFCGSSNFQLLLSRRSPRILNGNYSHSTDKEWGFTVVRRENPSGNRRSSSYTYLSPVGADDVPENGNVLTFYADRFPIFPEGSKPYVRETDSGTLVKLYEYSLPGHRTHILRKSGILGRLELLLPELALPIRLHECRQGYSGHEGSFDTTLTGLAVRLEEGGKADNLEQDFPSSAELSCGGEPMNATIYAFKKGKAETYRTNEGIIFTVNGQTHGHLTLDFFKRTRVGLSYLADSTLVIIDCTQISGRGRELLFMNSRDRLRDGELRRELEHEIEDILKNHAGLRALTERRRREEINAKLEDAKPLEQILDSLLKHSPSLASLFLLGNRASNPFKQINTAAEDKPYEGKTYPTYFKFKGKDFGETLNKNCQIDARCRIAFETDAANDYFSRTIDPGSFSPFVEVGGILQEAKDAGFSSNVNLQNGIASLSIKLSDAVAVGDSIRFIVRVSDAINTDPFENQAVVFVLKAQAKSGGKGQREKPSNDRPGDDREQPSGIELPRPIPVTKEEWDTKNPPFDQYTALRIRDSGERGQAAAGREEAVVYDFMINVDNVHLLRYLKTEVKKGEDKVAKARFELGMMLMGLAIIHQNRVSQKKLMEENSENCNAANLETSVEEFTRAVAPFILPMIDALGALDESTVSGLTSGEAT